MSKFRLIIIASILLGLLIPSTAGLAASDLSRFEVVNHSDQPITFWMYEATAYKDPALDGTQYKHVENGSFYFLTVGAGQRTTFTVKRALYAYNMTLCGGETRTGAIDLNSYNRMIIPACSIFALQLPGLKAGQELEDVTELATLVKFKATNVTSGNLFLTVSGEGSTYNFVLAAGEVKEITVDAGSYTYSYSACNKLAAATAFTPYFHTNLKLACP